MTELSRGRLAARRVYSGKVLDLDVDTVRFPDGSTGELEIIRHSGASAVLPVLSPESAEDPQILFIRQYRYAAGGTVWEVPAGRLDPGETPEACAARELLEETGARSSRLERLTTIYTTPGFTDEQIHLFAAWDLALSDNPRREQDEFLEVTALQMSRALELIKAGEIVDAKTVVAVLFFAGFRLGL
jgi:ADP-ribose pyrophosphatase